MMSSPVSVAFLAVVILGGTTACGADSVTTKTFAYKTTPQGKLSLTAYFPPNWQADQRCPAIVFFFGGGWTKGSVAQNDEQRARAVSPTLHLRRDSPPTLILFGTDDRLLAQGEEFMARSKELGHSAQLYLADGVGHGFFNRPAWRQKTLARVDEFLVSLGYRGEPQE